MKKIKLLFLTLTSILAVSANISASPFSITESQINQYLQEKGAIADKFGLPGLFFLDYEVRNLSTKIGQTNDKHVEMSGTLEGLFQFGNKKLPGKLNLTFDTIPYYNPEEGALYLKEMRILHWSGEPQQYIQKMQTIMPFLNENIARLLESIPVYTLDKNNMRDALIKKFAKKILIEQGKLTLDTGIF
ncbi:DUF1439 domain-containing protein [Haemophilus haemolyticus]|uniref:DUF1439 domain-containing protein n=1 Tax=Haemophilus haemolyticus TaxID=726 RepID=A0A502LE39_HAEHA|nr:DUF1439 domain-containing protein [Haemophilus haemolyticus]TPH20083.1 DUF1439 domain-containing protein [Haemophilus haemolyticus]